MAIQQGYTLRDLPGYKVLTQLAQQLLNLRRRHYCMRGSPLAAWLSCLDWKLDYDWKR